MKDIILIALQAEAPEMSEWDNVFFTGVGKINAALTAATLIEKYKPQRVWNFGTCGGITLDKGLHEIKNFVERDRSSCPISLEAVVKPEANLISFGEGYTCSTGDDFVMDPNLSIPADVVEMEAYAIAKACKRAGVEFRCYKYVSDGANEDSADDWVQSVHEGEQYYIEAYNG
jgi:adenosylhomocysteine nucleosidase